MEVIVCLATFAGLHGPQAGQSEGVCRITKVVWAKVSRYISLITCVLTWNQSAASAVGRSDGSIFRY